MNMQHGAEPSENLNSMFGEGKHQKQIKICSDHIDIDLENPDLTTGRPTAPLAPDIFQHLGFNKAFF